MLHDDAEPKRSSILSEYQMKDTDKSEMKSIPNHVEAKSSKNTESIESAETKTRHDGVNANSNNHMITPSEEFNRSLFAMDPSTNIDYDSKIPVQKLRWVTSELEKLKTAHTSLIDSFPEQDSDDLKRSGGLRPTTGAAPSVLLLDNVKENNAGIVYVENPSTGRFHRCNIDESLEENERYVGDGAGARREYMLKRLLQKLNCGLLFVQGLLAGLCMYTLYESRIGEIDGSHVMMGLQRMYFVFNSVVLAGVILKGNPRNAEWSGMTYCMGIRIAMVVLYFVSMVLTLSVAKLGLILQLFLQQGGSLEDMDSRKYCAIGITRSVCCILAWLLGSYNIVF